MANYHLLWILVIYVQGPAERARSTRRCFCGDVPYSRCAWLLRCASVGVHNEPGRRNLPLRVSPLLLEGKASTPINGPTRRPKLLRHLTVRSSKRDILPAAEPEPPLLSFRSRGQSSGNHRSAGASPRHRSPQAVRAGPCRPTPWSRRAADP